MFIRETGIYIRVLPRLETKAEQVGVVWAEFGTTSTFGMIHQRKTSVEGIGGHSAERAWGEHCT